MSKYRPLAEHLAARTDDLWRASFQEIEAVLGAALPKAAHQAPWWTGTDKPHQRAWLDHDWQVADVAAGVVSFRRTVPHDVQPPAMKAAAEKASSDAHLRQTAGVAAIAGAAVAVVAGLGVLAAKLIRGRKG